MKDGKGQSEKAAVQEKKRASEAESGLAKEQARRKAYLAQEEKIAAKLKAWAAKESEKRAAEEPARLAKEEARTRTYSAQEQKIADRLQAVMAAKKSDKQ